MARFNFRHGIARRQQDSTGNPTFLLPSNGGSYVDLIVSPDPTVFICSHFEENYMVSENATVTKAWGPFVSNVDYWLYWDIDFITGALSRGYTDKEPETGPIPPTNLSQDLHWFDTSEDVMKVWTGSSWLEKLRVFACKYRSGAIIEDYPLRSQVGQNNRRVNAGTILFDPDGSPVQKFQRNRRGRFITTETPMHSQFNRIGNFRVEAAISIGRAQENIPVHHCIAYYDYDELILARNTAPDKPAIGLAMEDMYTGEVRSYITKGFVIDEVNWDWSMYPVGTPLFCGDSGQILAETPPSQFSFQQIGYIVNRTTIFVNLGPTVEIDPPGSTNEASLYIDISTGRWRTRADDDDDDDCECDIGDLGDVDLTGVQHGNILAFNSSSDKWEPIVNSGVVPPAGANRPWGYCHEENPPSDMWMISHGLNTDCVLTEVYDSSGNQVLPDDVDVIDNNNLVIYFKVPMAGKAHIILSV